MLVQRLVDVALEVAPWRPLGMTIAAVVLFVVVATTFPKVLITSSLASYAVLVANSAVIKVPLVDMRAAALAQVIYLAMLRGRLPRFAVLRQGIFPAIGAYILLATALMPWATSASTAFDAAFNAAVAAALAWVLLCAADADEIRAAIRLLSGIVVILSLVWVYYDPGAAIAGSRWRGITTNANTLGIFAGCFFLAGKNPRSQWSLVPVAWALLGSASRASTFGLGLVAGPKVLERQSKWIRRAIATVAIICAIPIVHAVFFSSDDAGGGVVRAEPTVGRTTNSRAEFWEEAVDLIKEHPYAGVGAGSQPELVSSSILSPMVQLGLLALVPLGLVAHAALRRFPSEASTSRSIFLFLSVNAFFEMWLFAGGSIIFLLYAVCAVDPARVTSGRHDLAPQVDEDDDGSYPIPTGPARLGTLH